jgi:hypothetical protein
MDRAREDFVATIFAKACAVSAGAGPRGFSRLRESVAKSEDVSGARRFPGRAKAGRATRPASPLPFAARMVSNPSAKNIERAAALAISHDAACRVGLMLMSRMVLLARNFF